MILETERLILRYFNENDIDDLVEGLNNINVSKWLANVPFPYTKEHAKSFIEHCNHKISEKTITSYNFAIVLKEENKVIGAVTLNRIDFNKGSAGGGLWINEKYHGKGYGREAFGRRIEFAFNTLNLIKLENGFFKGNNSSKKMQLSLGYNICGIRKNQYTCLATGITHDEITTFLLKKYWINNQEVYL